MTINNNYKRAMTGLVLLVLLGSVSCKKTFYTDVNKNPNAPSEQNITPSVLLAPVEASLGYLQGGDLSRFTSLTMQQVKGEILQASAFYQYIYTSQDFDNLWGNIYTSVLDNDQILMQMSDAKGFNAYSGVARILKAYTLQLAVDAWGSIPYSQALQGTSNLQPTFDTGKGLDDSVLNLVDAGIAKLSMADPGALKPGDEDVIYNGKADRWIKFGHAIKMRIYAHQSKGNASMAVKALQEAAMSFVSNDDNAQYKFGNTETSANPWYQFNSQRTYISFAHGNTAAMMTATKDPRLPILIDTAQTDDSKALLYYGAIDAPVEFITYDETEFVSAEMLLRNGGTFVAAQTFLNQAIKVNMQKLGVKDADITTYVTTHGQMPTTSVDAAIGKIATEEYLALYLNPEAWTVWRRTGSPALTPVSGQNVPRRFLYPQTEYSYNKNNVPGSVTLFSPRIFWDK